VVLLSLMFIGWIVYAILAELEKGREALAPPPGSCPDCARSTDADWLICPHCRAMLRERCAGCGRQRAVQHRYCPRCGKAAEHSP